ncbi:diguanylate cyclase [Clostridiales bacterium]|nr:diguanylate cyclase [Clostridiales bacterium]
MKRNRGMEATPQEKLFEYLRQIIFEEEPQSIQIKELPEDLRDLGSGLQLLDLWMGEVKRLSLALSDGDLDADQPRPDNVLADPLKSLQATMKHIAWQAKQISKGDYSQKIDYMGEFSMAFNDMTLQLSEKQEALEKSRDDAIKAKQMLQEVMDGLERYFIILGEKDQRVRYENDAFRKLQAVDPKFAEQLKIQTCSGISGPREMKRKWEIEIQTEKGDGQQGNRYFVVDANFLLWNEEPVIACIIEDISEERRKEQKIQEVAFFDALTGLHNRRYIMAILEKWLEEADPFVVTFIDLDNLKFANDEAGHEEGDKYIKQAADLLTSVKGTTEVARIGGDEFLLLVKNCSEEELHQELEEKRTKLFQMGQAENAFYLKSFSYGIVEADSLSSSRYRSELLREADKRMYEYKMKNKPRIKRSTEEKL